MVRRCWQVAWTGPAGLVYGHLPLRRHGNPGSVSKINAADEQEQAFLVKLAGQKPVDLLAERIETPGRLDERWASFSVTGDCRYVRKIAWVFDADANEANVPNWAIIQGAAAWSLRSNAKQHAKVQQCLEDIAAAENEPIAVRSKIQELLAENEEDQGRSQ